MYRKLNDLSGSLCVWLYPRSLVSGSITLVADVVSTIMLYSLIQNEVLSGWPKLGKPGKLREFEKLSESQGKLREI